MCYSDTPLFVQLNERERRQFSGICSGSEVETHYDMIHFKRTPGNYAYLSELLTMFKEKLVSCVVISLALFNMKF